MAGSGGSYMKFIGHVEDEVQAVSFLHTEM